MSLKRNELNPLSVLGVRKLKFIPKHFVKIDLPFGDVESIDYWINFNLNGRYAIVKTLKVNQATNKIQDFLEIGMEDPKEISMFMLGCPYFKK